MDYKSLANKKLLSDLESSSESDQEWQCKQNVKKRENKIVGNSAKKHKVVEAEEGEVTDSESDDQFDDGLDDQLIRDEEDRKRLESMSEKEREQELYNRIEKREALKTRFEIEKKMRETRKLNERRESQKRASERRKRMHPSSLSSKKGSALEHLKTKREEKKNLDIYKRKERENELKRKPLMKSIYSDDDEDTSNNLQKPSFHISSSSSSSCSSSSSSPSSSEKEEEKEESRKKTQVVTKRQQLNDIRLSRHLLEKWCHYPMFPEVVVDCYVKIGTGRTNGKQTYKVACVAGVVETSKVYDFESTRTNKGLRLRYGNTEHVYRLKFVSNQEFSEAEFEMWKMAMEQDSCSLPTVHDVEQKSKVIQDTLYYKFTDEELTQVIAEKKRFQKVPSNYALEKTELKRQLDFARDNGDIEKENALKHQIENLEEQADEMYKRRSNNIKCIGSINERNRKKNMEDMVEACKREVAEMKNAKPDPFTRRQCRPTLVTKFRDSESRTHTTEDPQEDCQEEVQDVQKDKKEHIHHHNDLFSVHDFDISIDLGLGEEVPRVVKESSGCKVGERLVSGRRHLNLDEYKKKRGLI